MNAKLPQPQSKQEMLKFHRVFSYKIGGFWLDMVYNNTTGNAFNNVKINITYSKDCQFVVPQSFIFLKFRPIFFD